MQIDFKISGISEDAESLSLSKMHLPQKQSDIWEHCIEMQ